MAWSKPHTFQIDAMEQLGNTGLNWNSLQQYVSGRFFGEEVQIRVTEELMCR
jgi:hypothetical protein